MSLPTAQSMGMSSQPPAPLRKGMSALGRVPKKKTTGSYCDHSGWGSKQGNMIKNWKRRYFVLKGLELIYFAERSPSGKGLNEKGRLKIVAVDFTPDFHNAIVVTGSLKNRKMLMQLESNDDCKEWFSKISSALQEAKAAEAAAARQNASSKSRAGFGAAVMEGWLYKEGQNFKTWKKRYMTLTGNSLRYHEAKGEPPKDEVRVQSVNINKSRKFALDIYSDNNRILRIAASSFEEIEAWDLALAQAIHRRPCFGGDALSDQPAPFLGMDSMLDADCDGWLYMPGHLTSALKKRYFTLKRSILQYADHPGENSRGEGSVIDLRLGSQIQQLEVKLDDGKWICVTADSMDEYKKWLYALCDVLDRVPSSLEQATEPVVTPGHFSLKTVGTLVMMGQRLNGGIGQTGLRTSDLRNEESIKKTGWLRKEGQRMKSWKRRYFVLEGSSLQYYENVGMKVLKGGGEVDRVVPSSKHSNGLDIHFTSGRVLYVAGDSSEEIHDWLQTFEGKQPSSSGNPALARKSTMGSRVSESTFGSNNSSTVDPFEFARGWLLKQGKNFKTWKQRYFVLHGRSLSYAKGVDETALGTGIVQHVAFSDSRPFALDVQLGNGRVLTLVANVEDEFMMWCRAFKAAFEHNVDATIDDSDDELSDFDNDDQDDGIAILDTQRFNPALLPLPSLEEDDDILDDVDELVDDPSAPSGDGDARASDAEVDVATISDKKELEVNALFNTDMVICSGWLRKQGGNIKSWKERFFTLYGTLLRYYKTENGPLLGGATIVHVSTVRTRKHCYEITLQNGRNLLVLAESETEADRWLDAFRRATSAAKEEKERAAATAAVAAAAAAESSTPVRRGLSRATASAHLLGRSGSSSSSAHLLGRSGSSSSSLSSASTVSNEQTETVYEV